MKDKRLDPFLWTVPLLQKPLKRVINTPFALLKQGETNLSQALFGEEVLVHGLLEQKALIQTCFDDYVGFVDKAYLAESFEPTHFVSQPTTLAVNEPKVQGKTLFSLSFGAKVKVLKKTDKFALCEGGFYVPFTHLSEISLIHNDPSEIAHKFLTLPYLWGGRGALGIDCSGLTQMAFAACGVNLPRDSDMQERCGSPIATLEDLKRNDLIFWKGHVGIMKDSQTLIHANGFHLSVVEEPLNEAIARIETPITAMKRIHLANC